MFCGRVNICVVKCVVNYITTIYVGQYDTTLFNELKVCGQVEKVHICTCRPMQNRMIYLL